MEHKTNGLAIAGFCVSIASLFINLFGVVSAVGLVLSCVARSQIKQTGAGGKGMATAGIVIGIIGIIWAVISIGILAAAV